MKRRSISAFLALMAAVTMATSGSVYGFTAYAAGEALGSPIEMNTGDYLVNNGTVDFGEGTASITINGNEGQSLAGKRFEVFRLFDAENAQYGESINYTFNSKYAATLKNVVAAALNQRDNTNLKPTDITEYQVIDYIQTLNNNEVEGAHADQELEGRYSAFRYFVEQVRDEIKDQGITGDLVYVNGTRADNSIRLTGLQYGYYVIDEISEHGADGSDYYAASLCMVDTANPSAAINIKSDYPTIIKKVQEDDHQDAIGNQGWNDIADAEIGQTVPFRYTSTISDMNGYQTYYYAWHDQMDDGLTFNSNKNSISIVITNGKKEYKVKNTEYNILTSGASLDPEDTFLIEITDIKAIIDREFHQVDSLGHNDYSGMTVILDYEATVNDNAATDTGRPGEENDVRLEYSNNPDSDGAGETGYTPWDTVVVFTFKINGLKVNDHDNTLEGAKFRLYSDADCQNEVYVKAKADSTGTDAKGGGTTSGETDNVTSPDGGETNFDGDSVEIGNNGYIVINRDSVGGDDHTGGTVPADAVEMVSDKNGNFTIYGLDQGTYYLKETEAPAGYRPLLDPIVITITPTYTSDRNDYVAGEGATDETLQQLTATAHIKEFYDGEYKEGDAVLNTDISDGSADIKIINEVGSKLPVTGSNGMMILFSAGVALMGGAYVANRRCKKKNGIPEIKEKQE